MIQNATQEDAQQETQKSVEAVLFPAGFQCMERSQSGTLFYKNIRSGEIVLFNGSRKTITILPPGSRGGILDRLSILSETERAVLEYYREHFRDGATAGEVAEALDLNKHAVYKMRKRLMALGYMDDDGRPTRKNPRLAHMEPAA